MRPEFLHFLKLTWISNFLISDPVKDSEAQCGPDPEGLSKEYEVMDLHSKFSDLFTVFPDLLGIVDKCEGARKNTDFVGCY